MNFTRDGEKLVIASALRTPIGQAGKSLSKFQSFDLGAMVVEELFKRNGLSKEEVDSVIVGEIAQSSKAPNVARVISVRTGLPLEASALTVANNCVSGFEAIFEASRRIIIGESELVLVAGQESMSNMPIYLKNAQHNPKTATVAKILKNWDEIPQLEDVQVTDGVDEGLVDPVRHANMAETGEVVAQILGIEKQDLDQYAHGSYSKALKAIQDGKYKPWLLPIEHEKGILENDEFIMSKTGFVEKPERFKKATAIFEMLPGGIQEFYKKYESWIGKSYEEGKTKGSVSLFNACPKSDGAGALLVTTESKAKELGLEIQAYIKGWGNFGVDPIIMGLGIAHSMKKALDNAELSWSDIGIYEIHEAFAATALGSMRKVKEEYGFDLEKMLNEGTVNPNGGTLALGHPLGMTGIRVVINQLMDFGQNPSVKYTMGSICAGGGVGGAIILENPKS
ncbi:MAG: thiolase family protein [Leptospirales bacterium]